MDTARGLDTVHAVNWMAPAEDVLTQGADFTLTDGNDDPLDFDVPGLGARGFSVETDAVIRFTTPRSVRLDPEAYREVAAKAGRRYDVRVVRVLAQGTTAADLTLYL